MGHRLREVFFPCIAAGAALALATATLALLSAAMAPGCGPAVDRGSLPPCPLSDTSRCPLPGVSPEVHPPDEATGTLDGVGEANEARAPHATGVPARIRALDGTTWSWIQAECVGRELDLPARGFEQWLRIGAWRGGFLLVSDSYLAAEGCTQTVVHFAKPPRDRGGWLSAWRIEEQARVALPNDVSCLGQREDQRSGELRLSGRLLELLVYRSALCGGFDIRFVYSRAPQVPLGDQQLIRHYVAHFNRRDEERLAALFAERGSLLAPRLRAQRGSGQLRQDRHREPHRRGNPHRHRGRKAVRAWFASVFDSVDWVSMRLLSIEETDAAGQYIANWTYMDSHLAEPFGGRNLFLLADGEIFETEVQSTTHVFPKNRRPSSGAEGSPRAQASSGAEGSPRARASFGAEG